MSKRRLIIKCRARNLKTIQRNVQRLDMWPDGKCPTIPQGIEDQWIKPTGEELKQKVELLKKKF